MYRGRTSWATSATNIIGNSTELEGIWLKAKATGKYWDSVSQKIRTVTAENKICQVGVPDYGNFAICIAAYIGPSQ